ncbi:MAG: hypothetical protein CSA33_00260 [Desulfobulbus propionicus]|nr:MAG: hypothetical protein CSA33_00260 [Desulfobulbus propionicus]
MPQRLLQHICSFVGLLLYGVLASYGEHTAGAVTLESFLEPDKQVDIVPVNRDIVTKLHVVEGDSVKKGQLLVTLDLGVLNERKNIAQILATNHGRLDSAQALVNIRQAHLENLKRLESTGHVRQKELEVSRADLAVAQADLLTAQEERTIRQAELRHIEAQIEVKKIRSPIDGLVSRVYKTEGELVGLNDEDALISVVSPHPLHVIFYLPHAYAEQIAVGQQVALQVGVPAETVLGKVLFVAPLVHPESGTIRVKIGFAQGFVAQSGIRCSLDTDQLTAP